MKKVIAKFKYLSIVAPALLLPYIAYAQKAEEKSLLKKVVDPLGFFDGSVGVMGQILAKITDVSGWILSPVISVILEVMSWITMLSAVALNYVIKFTVVDMALHYRQISAINITWGTVRDLSNMVFIFILLYAAIKTILGIGKDTQKLIVNTIIFAVLINFSLFFTQLIIDASNVLAITFYNAIVPGASTVGGHGISDSITNLLGIQTIWSKNNFVDSQNILAIGIMGTIVLLVSSFVFIAAAMLLLIRYVVLVMVIVLSPIAFVAQVFPTLDSLSKQWWRALLGQSFFAPIYFLLLWVSISILQGIGGPNKDFAAVLGGATSFSAFEASIGTFVNFAIVIIFMIASLIIAKQWADQAGPGVKRLTSAAIGWGGDKFYGTVVGGAARNTIGRLGEKFAGNTRLIEATKKAGASGAMARLGLLTSKKLGAATFDARNARIPVKSAAEGLGIALGGAIDEAKSRGVTRFGVGKFDVNKYEAALSSKIERNVTSPEIASAAASQVGVGQGGTESFKSTSKEDKEKRREFEKNRAKELKKAADKTTIKKGEAEAEKKKVGNPHDQAAIGAMVDIFKKMSKDEIKEQKASTLALQDIAEALNQKQLDSIEESGNYTAAEIDSIKKSRSAALNETFTNRNYTEAINLMGRMKAPELAKLKLLDPADPDKPSLNHPQIVELYNSTLLGKIVRQDDFTQDKVDAVRQAIIDEWTRITSAGGTPSPKLDATYKWLTTGKGAEIFL